MVARHDAPAVFFGAVLDVALADVDHWLDGEHHAGLEFFHGAGAAVVHHLRLFMEFLPNAVAAKFTHHGVAVFFGKRLDRMAHIAQARTGLDLHDAVPHGFVGDLAEPLGGNRAFADQEHAAAVAVPAVLDAGHVQVQDVAFFQRLVVRDAMADLVVERGAQRLGVGRVAGRAVTERGRNRLLHVDGVVVRQLVDFVGGHAGFDERRQVVQQFASEPAGHAQAFNTGCIFVSNTHPGIIPPESGACFSPRLQGFWRRDQARPVR